MVLSLQWPRLGNDTAAGLGSTNRLSLSTELNENQSLTRNYQVNGRQEQRMHHHLDR